ncbi:Smr/MutS family protein [Thermospira aquatica]|uniref:Smr/MutS family protein n=1 Tax=Thermospira aquatica TaxID=2828656 RepID=A0AAX3BB36_9SPIR|nr:Smr/MutS family protein [Thermospira aquatica]URA09523.1 Smr/MutS family protein [Thermospira aquatica]
MDDRKVAEDIFLKAIEDIRFVPPKEKKAEPLFSEKVFTVDFHGLSLQKALQRLDDILEMKRTKKIKAVTIIVGKGEHSPTVFPVVGRAVEAVLIERGITYRYEKGVIYL